MICTQHAESISLRDGAGMQKGRESHNSPAKGIGEPLANDLTYLPRQSEYTRSMALNQEDLLQNPPYLTDLCKVEC